MRYILDIACILMLDAKQENHMDKSNKEIEEEHSKVAIDYRDQGQFIIKNIR